MLPREPRRREFSSLVATLLPRKTRGDLLQTQKLLQLAIAICDKKNFVKAGAGAVAVGTAIAVAKKVKNKKK